MTAPLPTDAGTQDALLASIMRTRKGLERWCPPDRLLEASRTELLDHLSHTVTDDWCRKFHDAIGIGEPEAYRQRVVSTNGGAVFCGIRFFRGERDRPFVELISCSDASLTLDQGARIALDAFASFSPAAVQIEATGDEPPTLPDDWCIEPDQLLLVGNAHEMRSEATPHVGLIAAPVDEAEAFMNRAYESFKIRDSQLADRVPPASREQLEECRERGRLVFWTVEGERAGLLGVAPDTLCGLAGWCVMEEVADPAWIGRGLAAHAQRQLAVELTETTETAPVVFGTIDARNIASVKTATRAGRSVAHSWWFVSPK